MINYLRDHILEILAILVALIIFYLQRRKKSLTYSILTNSDVISISDKIKDNNKIQIKYLGKRISNLHLLEIRVKNTGNLPIKPDDYIEPLVIRYPETASLISVEVIDQRLLGVYIQSEESDSTKTILSKTLLNPNDFFDMRILLGDGSRDFSITGRIVGLSKIQTSSNRRLLINAKPSTWVFLSLFYVFLIIVSIDKVGIVESITSVSIAFLIALGLVVLSNFLDAFDRRFEK